VHLTDPLIANLDTVGAAEIDDLVHALGVTQDLGMMTRAPLTREHQLVVVVPSYPDSAL